MFHNFHTGNVVCNVAAKKCHDRFMDILSAENLHILSQRNKQLHSMWTITIDDHTCHDEILLMIQHTFHDPDAFIEKLFHDHSLPAIVKE